MYNSLHFDEFFSLNDSHPSKHHKSKPKIDRFEILIVKKSFGENTIKRIVYRTRLKIVDDDGEHYFSFLAFSGGWGFVVVLVAILVQIITHGLQLSFGVLALAISRRWSTEEADFIQISE